MNRVIKRWIRKLLAPIVREVIEEWEAETIGTIDQSTLAEMQKVEDFKSLTLQK